MSEATGQTWTDEQFAAYELGMQTEREHQNALSRLVMEKHAQALAAKEARIAELEAQLAERDASFDLRWNADMRAIQQWQEATGEELKWPNHVDLCVWLMQQLAEARIDAQMWHDRAMSGWGEGDE